MGTMDTFKRDDVSNEYGDVSLDKIYEHNVVANSEEFNAESNIR